MPDDTTRVTAIRGATTAIADTAESIRSATVELLGAMLERNGIAATDVVSVVFAVTSDLRSAYPARAAREMGWTDVPLLCTAAQEVDGSLPRCIRVLLHVAWPTGRGPVGHVYLREARNLRPDLTGDG